LRIDRRLDLYGIGSTRLSAVERHFGRQIRAHPERQLIDDASAETKADSAELACAVRTRRQLICRREEIFSHLGVIELAERRQLLLVVSGVAAEGSQCVRCRCDEIGDSQPSRHIFKGRDEDSRGQRGLTGAWLHSPAGPDSL
jgi:hypothetical protein